MAKDVSKDGSFPKIVEQFVKVADRGLWVFAHCLSIAVDEAPSGSESARCKVGSHFL